MNIRRAVTVLGGQGSSSLLDYYIEDQLDNDVFLIVETPRFPSQGFWWWKGGGPTSLCMQRKSLLTFGGRQGCFVPSDLPEYMESKWMIQCQSTS